MFLASKGFKAEYFQIGYNEEFYFPGESERKGIVFFGNNYPGIFPLSKMRSDMVMTLEKKFDDFEYYGNWRGKKDMNFKQKEEGDIYRSALMAVNVSHIDLKRYSSDRMFRAMACGAMMLTHRYQGIWEEFKEGVHLVSWESIEELCDLIGYYKNNETEAKEIAQRGIINKDNQLNQLWLFSIR
jgi:spore maturation protein CgeB